VRSKNSKLSAEQKRHHARVADLGCIVCWLAEGFYSPAEIHHPFGQASEKGKNNPLGLCYEHHRIGVDCDRFTSVHSWKKRFYERYGSAQYLLKETARRLQ